MFFNFLETHEGVQDMACDTFIKIAQKCKRHFVTVQVGEVVPFIEEILASISSIICDLNNQQVIYRWFQFFEFRIGHQRMENNVLVVSCPQVHTFYEAVGLMISAQVDQIIQDQLIEKYMMLPNQVWDDIINSAAKVSIVSWFPFSLFLRVMEEYERISRFVEQLSSEAYLGFRRS